MARPDYYAILGVLPSAEDVVIKAAYRALAQRYHPDKFKGDPTVATEKMSELNEAFSVLSDSVKRRAYDSERGQSATESDEVFRSDAADSPPPYDPLEDDWKIAIDHFPDLVALEGRLRTISWRLSYAFRIFLLEMKCYGERAEFAAHFEAEFLRRYFGDDLEIVEFAKILIFDGKKEAARELNRAVSVVGNAANASVIISRIANKFLPKGYYSAIRAQRSRSNNSVPIPSKQKKVESVSESLVDKLLLYAFIAFVVGYLVSASF